MIRIAIDGPGGAGKSTIAKLVSDRFGIDYVDTGAMYRAIALKVLNEEIELQDDEAISNMLDRTAIDFDGRDILLDGVNVSKSIRTPEISKAASNVSKLPSVRNKVSSLSRQLAESKSLVMDGRDIGTNVIKDAEVKVFLTADPMVRAKRRVDQLIEAGKEADIDEIFEDIKQRDYQDSHRELNPLRQADDAVLIDSSYMTIEDVVKAICELADQRQSN